MNIDMDIQPMADLYIRVSTDEQADKGYSQRSQEEMLRRYCDNNAIEIRDVIYEDHSAKSFNRPEWRKLINRLKNHKNKTDFILFTKWDRFSRNAGDAYQMINVLRGFGAEPQAIEQPLDLSIPENKMMLAFYLAAPEVENDRRALNVFYGMRKAKKEGRYMGLAPIGYTNKTDESGNKFIAPKEPQAAIIKWAFEQIGQCTFNTEQIWKKAKEKGLSCSKNAFWQLIRNPLYSGQIFIPAFKEEENRLIEGQHEPIISIELFNQVQDILDGRGRKCRTKIETAKEFWLKGFLICPRCGRQLTASRSKGRNSYYAYYHCFKGCSYRLNAEKLDKALRTHLGYYYPRKEIIGLFRKVVAETYYDQTEEMQIAKKRIIAQLKDLNNKMSAIRDLLATSKIDAEDYCDVKAQYTSSIQELTRKLEEINNRLPDIDGLLGACIDNFMKFDEIICLGNNEEMRYIINILYPAKLIFYGYSVGEAKLTEIFKRCYQYSAPH